MNKIDSYVGGVFLDKEADEGYDFLGNLAANDLSSSRSATKKKSDIAHMHFYHPRLHS